MLDCTKMHGAPLTVPLDRVIAGLSEGVRAMVTGERARLWLPEALTYQGRPGAPAGMLVYEVELLEIVEPPAAPESLATAPRDATRTDSGLAFVVRSPEAGRRRPGPSSLVIVHYSGWNASGALIDSSVLRGQPATFRLDQAITGWSEGLRLMTTGEKRRYWIPASLAFGEAADHRPGPVVFDLELLAILD